MVQNFAQNRLWPAAGASVALAGLGGKILFILVLFAIVFFGAFGGIAFHGDVRPLVGIFGIDLQPFFKARLGVGFDRFGGTFRLTDTAVDTLVGMNDEHIFTLVKTIDRAYLDAVHVLTFDTVFDDDIGHPRLRIIGHTGPAKSGPLSRVT